MPSLLVGTIGIASTSMKASTYMLCNPDSSLIDKPRLDIFWNLESIGIMDSPLTSDDNQALEMFNNTVKFDNGKYFVSGPGRNLVLCYLTITSCL